MIREHNIFPITVWQSKIPITEEVRNSSLKYCKLLQQQDPQGTSASNIGGWQSKSLTFNDICNTPLIEYFKYIKICVDDIFKDLDTPLSNNLVNTWVNINRENDFNISHSHPGSVLSGSFYLTKNNSGIVFKRPADAYTSSLFALSSRHNTYHSMLVTSFKPELNDLFIFPSWLDHFVQPNQSNEERISIAFNVCALHAGI